jgi:hypothetical protein
MRTVSFSRAVLIVAALFVCGCSSNKGKIEGTKWNSVAATVKDKQLPAGALRLEFGSDGSLVYVAGLQRMTGKYSLGMGENLTMNLDQELAGSKKHMEKVKIEGDKLTMTDGDGTSLTFTKDSK